MKQIANLLLFPALALAMAGAVAAEVSQVKPPSPPPPWTAAAFMAMHNADALPAYAAAHTEPTTLVWRLHSREAGVSQESQVQSLTLTPGRSPYSTTSRVVQSDTTGPLWCFETTAARFEDGSWRFSGGLFDPTCKTQLAEQREFAADGSSQTFHGRMGNGVAISVQLLARRFALPANFVWIDVGVDQNLKALSPAGMQLLGPMGAYLRLQSKLEPGDTREPLAVDVMTTADGADRARIKARLLFGTSEQLLAEPQIVTRWGEPARLVWEDKATGRRVEVKLTPHRSLRKPPR